MRRGPLQLVVGIAVATAFVAWGVVRWRSAQADEAVARARALLSVPLAQAPELHEIAAGDALEALDRAASLGREERFLRHYAQALVHLRAGDLIFAEGSLSAARHEAGRWTADLRVLAGAIDRARLRPEEALAHVEAALARDPAHPRALLLRADLALDARDGRTAVSTLARLLEEAPQLPALHNRRGLALELGGAAEAAEAAYRRAVALDATFASAWINLGRALRARGALDEATAAFAQATEHAVGDADAWLGRGLCALDHGDLAEARAAFERVVELAPHEVGGRVGLGDVALAEGDIDAALASYRAAVRELPRDAALWVKLGNALVRGHATAEAEQAFRQAIALDAALAAAHNGLGAVLLGRGQYAEAAEALRRAAELDPADPHPLMNLALLHERSGERQRAAEAWRAALARDPSSPIARRRLATL